MIQKYFKLDQLGSTVRQEVIAGASTFVTMAYIILVNPKILEAAGIPFGPSMVATILTAFFGTLIMGVYANRPFAIAPYMGQNAFIAFTVVKVLGYSWQTALGAIFISGVLFTLLTILKIRSWLANAIPECLKIGFAVGIGFFLAFIGLNETGIVSLGVQGAPVRVGNLSNLSVLLSIFCFLLISLLMIAKVRGAILIGIIVTSIVAFFTGVTSIEGNIVSLPPSLEPTFLQFDLIGALSWGFLGVILTVFVMDFIDTTGTILGLALKSDLLDKDGNLPDIEKPMLADSLSTIVASLLGTTTAGVYLESAAGIEEGGKSGLTSVVTAFLFLLMLFLSPLLVAIPKCAYGPALIVVGMLMLSPIAKVKFNDLTEVIPVFSIIALMSFTYDLAIGMTSGFLVYVIVKSLTGRIKEIPTGLWVLAALSLIFFIVYPY